MILWYFYTFTDHHPEILMKIWIWFGANACVIHLTRTTLFRRKKRETRKGFIFIGIFIAYKLMRCYEQRSIRIQLKEVKLLLVEYRVGWKQSWMDAELKEYRVGRIQSWMDSELDGFRIGWIQSWMFLVIRRFCQVYHWFSTFKVW